jgi:flagellar FliJ protein
MKQFGFKLQKVLDLRKYREEEAKIELGRAVGVLTEIENRIRLTAKSRHHAAGERFTEVRTAGAAGMLAWDNYITRLDQEAERLAKEAARAELAVEEKRARYLEASRELKIMEKLKEKKEKEYRKEMSAAETAELDGMWRVRNES